MDKRRNTFVKPSQSLESPAINLLGILFFLLSVIALCLLTMFRGVGIYDDSVFLTIARGITRGLVPYVDLFDTKPPGIYYLFAALGQNFGGAWWVARTFLCLVNIIFIAIFFYWIRRDVPEPVAWWGASIFTLSLLIVKAYQVNTRVFAALFASLGLITIYASGYRSLLHNLIFGFLIGLAGLFNQQGYFYLIAFAFVYLVDSLVKRRSIKIVVTNLALVSIVSMIPLVIVFGYYWRIQASQAFFEATILQSIPFLIPGARQPFDKNRLITQLTRFPALLLSVFLLGGHLILRIASLWENLTNCTGIRQVEARRSIATRSRALVRKIADALTHPHLLLWMAAILGMSTIVVRYFSNHMALAVFPLSYLCAVLYADLRHSFRQKLRIGSGLDVVLTVLLAAMLVIIWREGPLRVLQEGRLGIDMQQGREFYAELSRCLEPDDRILVISSTPPRLYYLTQHYPPWRWLYIDDSNDNLVRWKDALDLIDAESIPAVMIEDRLYFKWPASYRGRPLPPRYEEFRAKLEQSYFLVDLEYSYHPIHRTYTEMYISQSVTCGRLVDQYPLFPNLYLYPVR